MCAEDCKRQRERGERRRCLIKAEGGVCIDGATTKKMQFGYFNTLAWLPQTHRSDWKESMRLLGGWIRARDSNMVMVQRQPVLCNPASNGTPFHSLFWKGIGSGVPMAPRFLIQRGVPAPLCDRLSSLDLAKIDNRQVQSTLGRLRSIFRFGVTTRGYAEFFVDSSIEFFAVLHWL